MSRFKFLESFPSGEDAWNLSGSPQKFSYYLPFIPTGEGWWVEDFGFVPINLPDSPIGD